MSECREPYCAGVFTPTQNRDRVDAQTHSDFVEVRTRRGKLIFRFDPSRMLVEWRESKDVELIDLKPLLPE